MKAKKIDIDQGFLPPFQEDLPKWLCPKCKIGRLSHIGEFTIKLTASSEFMATEVESDVCTEGMFHGFLQCDQQSCGERVAVSGVVKSAPAERDEQTGYPIRFANQFHPRWLHPSPSLMRLPEECPKGIVKLVAEASSLRWLDEKACSNRLRVVVEKILDLQKVPKNKTGRTKPIPIPLSERIRAFKHQDEEIPYLMNAIRWLGNTGSHERTRETMNPVPLLEGVKILEEIIDRLYSKKKTHILHSAKRLIKSKGR